MPPRADLVLPPSGLLDLLGASDYVVLAVPVVAGTEPVIDERAPAAVKPGAWLINVARGRLVDEAALLRALRHGRLGGAVLDTFRRGAASGDLAVLRRPARHRDATDELVEQARPGPEHRGVRLQP